MKFDLKKILALGLICIVVLTLAACENFPFVKPGTTTGGEGDNPDLENTLIFKLNTDGDAYIVAGVSSRSNKEIIIPEKYMGAPVVGIADFAFKNYGFIRSITIPDSVTSIGENAFDGCTSLTSVTIGNSVKSIGRYAFAGCKSLTSVTIPDSVTSIGYSAFYGCTSLKNVYYQGSLEDWCKIEFSYASNPCCNGADLYINGELLTNAVIPDGITNIGFEAFEGCTSLTSVTIPDSVTSISWDAFEGCTSLTEIHYNGTKAQWNSISKGSWWNSDTGKYTIYYTDGNISK